MTSSLPHLSVNCLSYKFLSLLTKQTDCEKTIVMYNLPSAVNDHLSFEKIQKNRRLLSLDHSYLNEQEIESKNKPNTPTLTLNHILSEICAYYFDVPRSRSTM